MFALLALTIFESNFVSQRKVVVVENEIKKNLEKFKINKFLLMKKFKNLIQHSSN